MILNNASRRTIGLLVSHIAGITSYEQDQLSGVHAAAEERDANLVIYVGFNLAKGERKDQFERNILFDIARNSPLDGLVVAWNVLGIHLTTQEMEAFVRRYTHVPVVTIGGPLKTFPNVLVDNQAGIKTLARHLAQCHGKKRIAFVSGYKGSDADERFAAYREALAELGLDCDEKITFIGDFTESSGRAAVAQFIQKGLAFDAVMAANDAMAFGATRELSAQGKRVPEDIPVVGFDDIEEAMNFIPPLTTVKQPVHDQAYRAVELLLDRLEGKTSGTESVLPTVPVIRESCGCSIKSVEVHRVSTAFQDASEQGHWERLKQGILDSAMADAGFSPDDRQSRADLERIADGLREAIQGNGRDKLNGVLIDILTKRISKDASIEPWREALSALRRRMRTMVDVFEACPEADAAALQADLVMIEFQSRQGGIRKVATDKRITKLRDIIQAMSATMDLDELHAAMQTGLAGLGMPSHWVSEYVDAANPLGKLKLLFGTVRGHELEPGVEYPSQDIVPRRSMPVDRHSIIAWPLVFKGKHLGIAAIEVGRAMGSDYETIFGQLSSSMMGWRMMTEALEGERALEERDARIQRLVRPMIDSIGRVNDLAKEKMRQAEIIAELTKISSSRIGDTNGIIMRVANSINEMAEIIKTIDEISETVNIVALNASIEATHAGNYGKGFAVIAKEIKKLAESTQIQASQVAGTIKAIIDNVRKSAAAGKETIDSFSEEEKGVVEIVSALEEIGARMGELQEGSTEILTVMEGKMTIGS